MRHYWIFTLALILSAAVTAANATAYDYAFLVAGPARFGVSR